MEDHEQHVGGEHRRGRLGLADHDPLGQHQLALVVDLGHLLGHAVPDVERAEVLRQPAPTLHVDDQPGGGVAARRPQRVVQGVAGCPSDNAGRLLPALLLKGLHRVGQRIVVDILLAAGRSGDAQALAQQGDVGMRLAGLELRSRRNAHVRGIDLRLHAACRQHGLPQPLELRMLRMQPAQVGIDRIGDGERRDQRLRIVDRRVLVEQLADRARVEPAAARMPPVLHDGEADLDLDIGQHLERGRAVDGRHLVVGRAQAPVVGLAQLGDGILGALGEAGAAGPYGLPVALGIERRQRREVFAASGAGLRQRGRQTFAHQGDDGMHLGSRAWLGRLGRGTRCGGRPLRAVLGRQRVRPFAVRGPGIETDGGNGLLGFGLAPAGCREGGNEGQR